MISLKSDTFKYVSGILGEYLCTFLPASYAAVSNPWCFNDSKTNVFLIFCPVQHPLVQEPNVIELVGISEWRVIETDGLIMGSY